MVADNPDDKHNKKGTVYVSSERHTKDVQTHYTNSLSVPLSACLGFVFNLLACVKFGLKNVPTAQQNLF